MIYYEGRTPPIVLFTILHIHCFPASLDETVIPSPARNDAITCLLKGGLIELCATTGSGFKTTPRGRAWVESLCASKWPVEPSAEPHTEPPRFEQGHWVTKDPS